MGASIGAGKSGGNVEGGGVGEVKKGELTPLKSELVPITFKTPENQAGTVNISRRTYDTLAKTIIFNVQRFNDIPEAERPDFLNHFIEEFKKQNPDLKDLKDQKAVAEQAGTFLRKEGGQNLLATFKLLETEGSLIYGSGGVRLKEKKAAKSTDVSVKEKIVFIGKDGAEIKDKTSFWDNFKRKGENITGEYPIEMFDTLSIGGTSNITDAKEIAYLRSCGFTDGFSIKTGEGGEAFLETVTNIALAREEMFRETGLKSEEVAKRMNFLDNTPTRRFITSGRVGHLHREARPGYTPSDFASEMDSTIAEIKIKTIEKLTKEKKEGTQKRYGELIRDKISDLEKPNDLSQEEKTAREGVIQQQMTEVENKQKLFTRQKLLPGEIQEAQKAYDEAKNALTEQASRTANLPGETINLTLLESWSDPTSAEGFQSLGIRLKKLKAEKVRLDGLITGCNNDITTEKSGRPSASDLKTETIDGQDEQGNPIRTTTTVDARITAEYDLSLAREKGYRDEIKIFKAKISTDIFEDGMTLDKLIVEIEGRYDRRKQVVDEDAVTQDLIKKYREKKRLLEQKNNEFTELPGKIDAIRTTPSGATAPETDSQIEDRLREEYGKLKKQKEKVSISNTDNQREALALELLGGKIDKDGKILAEGILTEKGKEDMRTRLTDIEGLSVEELKVSPSFKDYPPIVLQTVKLLFGPEALTALPDSDIFKKTDAFLRSKWYMQIIIDNIEHQNGIDNPTDPLDPPNSSKVQFTGSRSRGGPNAEITMEGLKTLIDTTTGPTTIATLEKTGVSRDTIEKIIIDICDGALGFK